METQSNIIIIEGPEARMVICEPVSFYKYKMVFINVPDCSDDFVIKLFERSVAWSQISIGLVKEVVAANPGFIAVTLGDLSPQGDSFFSIQGGFPK